MHNACIVCPKTTTGRISSRFLSQSAAKAEWESTQKRECFNASTDTTSNWSRITENSSTWKNQMLCPWNSACKVVLGRWGGLRTNSKQKKQVTLQSLGLLAQPKEGAVSSCEGFLSPSCHSWEEQRGQQCRLAATSPESSLLALSHSTDTSLAVVFFLD